MLTHKYISFFISSSFLLSILFSGFIYYHYSQQRILKRQINPLEIRFPVVIKQDKINIQRLSKKIPGLVKPSTSVISNLDLRPLGYRKTKQREIIIPEIEIEIEPETLDALYIKEDVKFNYKISMIYLSNHKSAVINGRFVKEGNVLSDGGKLLSIRRNKVLIIKSDVKKWIFSAK
jgi:hypothetical protein